MRVTNHMAILRNLRNISAAGVSPHHLDKVKRALEHPSWATGARRVLPFRYVAAARACPQLERSIDIALCSAISQATPLSGTTAVLVDVSGSMDAKLSAKSDMTRMDAAATLASIIPGDVRVFSFSNKCVEVPARRGMAGVDAVIKSQSHQGTELGEALGHVNKKGPWSRIIVITDEQSHDTVIYPDKAQRCYVVNVASNRNGVGYNRFIHIDGFSEAVLRFILEAEKADL